ncbi:hypothetical protein A3I99_01285 [Candidatus Kaiserbacteria bacterium RIFCSPLOWO2_02_FULL_45_11b]|uniref:Uncharacterized protein n=1 Tax=Candidatus Kaiserbacteria bacterium RIFCSPLOWO2_12_FULL_45_26 TaxID=1798525 RepID=A0A1F6FFR1_9BACT|nr:MAG: hypothetical protein A2Z56_02120 [Candidatus Kaiserbacteria bacterium RIFCSPHIGHO2_12_45_16]OGG70420.1 MAG: hypothetical protein A2929_01365 [Candidatus Kaiserbacteria bacterium RIFCSPLOWO2_01_FULL_45_25]OGG80951.1 MAG: hypothetical protein A3I99_01285 [Candidatus Kaiserbacteria bacterium RIFCSPLOWO2_02_FULL_45_11b]OGG84692.1 MAG: hypothetical protein A3G90_01230 [Candidatus Kaiserbacteria bacterium RIFCSPLOWO2_12_FULL_45_26]
MNRFFTFVILLLALASQPALAASFSDEAKAKHACLGQTSLPWRISPMKADTAPTAYAGWSGLYAGEWKGSGKPLCHVLIIESVGSDGKAKVLYSTGKPYYEHGTFDATISEKDDGVQVLELTLGNGTKASYMKTNQDPALKARYGDYAMGTLLPVVKD